MRCGFPVVLTCQASKSFIPVMAAVILFKIRYLFCLLGFSLVLQLVHTREFYYNHYSFRKKHRLSKQYKRIEKDCESLNCSREVGLDQIKCTRQCVSAHCYKEMYAWDELEEGEIDVRLNSFKGCVTSELQNKEAMGMT